MLVLNFWGVAIPVVLEWDPDWFQGIKKVFFLGMDSKWPPLEEDYRPQTLCLRYSS